MNQPPFPPPSPDNGDDLSRRLRSMVDGNAPAVTAQEAQYATAAVMPVRGSSIATSPVWKVAAASMGALALAGSALSYTAGRSAGKRAADKRVIAGNSSQPAGKPAAADSARPTNAPKRPPNATPAIVPGAGGEAKSSAPYGPGGEPQTPEEMYGPAPVKAFDRTVGTTTLHVYRQTMADAYTPENYPADAWIPPVACRNSAMVQVYAATSQFAGQVYANEYTSVDVPVMGYGGQAFGHPAIELVSVVPVQVPAGATNVRLIRDGKTIDEMAPNNNWAVLVDLNAKPSFDPRPEIEVVLSDGRTVKAVYDGDAGSPMTRPECQPPPPPAPTLMPDYKAITGADLDEVKAVLTDAFAANDPARKAVSDRVQNNEKFPADWYGGLQAAVADFNINGTGIELSSAGSKDGKAVAIFSITGTPIANNWQVVELVKAKDGKWAMTTPSYCRIVGMAYACPTDVFDPANDQGPPEVNYGYGDDIAGGVATTVAIGRPVPVPQPAPAGAVAPGTAAPAATTTAAK
jgi:hypothetical protein